MMDARFASPIFTSGQYTAMWDGQCGEATYHVARRDVGPRIGCRWEDNWVGAPLPELDSPEAHWAGVCERCGAQIPWDAPDIPCNCGEPGCVSAVVGLSSGTKFTWDTPSGILEPGCLYYELRGEYEHYCSGRWTNCDQRHLFAVLPNGHHWDIDSRASNCGSPQDFTHRCWVRHGEPPMVHVDKAGATCTAGAGSIIAGDWHGFLHDGQFTP